MPTHDTDILVIGSGFGAMPPALRLAESGRRVHILEKGPHVDTSTFRMTQDPAYLTRYLKGLSGRQLNLTFAEALGGGSGFYEMVSLRAPTAAFAQLAPEAYPLWPDGVDRATMDPFYDVAETMLRVEQIAEHQVPRSGLVFARLLRNLGYSCDRARYAVQDCLGSGYCVSGCVFGRKQSLHLNYLPQAVAAGATVTCETEALAIRPVASAEGHRYEVITRHRVTGARGVHRARVVILGGGTVGTARLLLISRRELPRIGRHLGSNIAFNGGARVAAILPSDFPSGDMYAGRSHPGMISYEFLDSHGLTISAMKPLPLQVIASARLSRAERPEAWWGEPHVDLMRQYRERVIVLISLGLTPPAGRIDLDLAAKPRLSLTMTAPLLHHRREAKALLTDILTRNGCEMLEARFVDHVGEPHSGTHFASAHHVGAARMADAPERGVCDASGEVFGYPGLFVTDGAAIPSSLAVNTSLTILANAERIAAGLVDRYGGRAMAGAQAKAAR